MHINLPKKQSDTRLHTAGFILLLESHFLLRWRVRNFHILFVEEETDDDGEKSAKKNLQMTHVLMRKKEDDENYVVLVNWDERWFNSMLEDVRLWDMICVVWVWAAAAAKKTVEENLS